VQIDANMHELIGAHGIGAVGSALSGVAVTDDTEAFVLTLPSLEPGDYDDSHQCATLDMPDLFTTHDGGIRVTAHTSADAVWGDIDATTAKVIRYILIGTELTRVWGYVRVTGRFAALRDAAIDCPNCTPMIDEVHNICTLPVCTEQGCSNVYCFLQSDACANVAPPFDGPYGGKPVAFHAGGVHLTFAHGDLTAIRIDGLKDSDTGASLVFTANEFPPGSVTQHGRDVHVAVLAQGSPPYETGNHIELDFQAGATLHVRGRLLSDSGDAIDLTTALARE
jgi:hypothetical protein